MPYHQNQNANTRSIVIRIIAAVIVIAIIVVVICVVVQCSGAQTNTQTNSEDTDTSARILDNNALNDRDNNASQDFPEDQTEEQPGLVSIDGLSKLSSAQSDPETFFIPTVGEVSETALSDKDRQALDAVLSLYDINDTSVGFLLVNLRTAQGISYNIDEEVYGASTFKALYAFYICEELIDTGKSSLDERITRYIQDEDGDYYTYGTSSIEDLIFDAIVYSDNGAFISLRDALDDRGLDTWLAKYDASITETPDSVFPTYSARNAAKLWLGFYKYLQDETETTEWLKELLSITEVSFMRDALSDYEGIRFLDKAGWCLGSSDSNGMYDSISDCGLVSYNDNAYILCIMTDEPCEDEEDPAINDFEMLTEAVFSTFIDFEESTDTEVEESTDTEVEESTDTEAS